MMKTMLMASSSYIIYSKNQMTMVILIIGTSCLVSGMMFLMSNTHWFSLLLLLIYISGIMVMFMFIVSLTPNEKTLAKTKSKKSIFIAMSIMMMSKIWNNSENLKINSSIEWSPMLMGLMVTVIFIMAYLPPKMINSFYSGMKSTK